MSSPRKRCTHLEMSCWFQTSVTMYPCFINPRRKRRQKLEIMLLEWHLLFLFVLGFFAQGRLVAHGRWPVLTESRAATSLHKPWAVLEPGEETCHFLYAYLIDLLERSSVIGYKYVLSNPGKQQSFEYYCAWECYDTCNF